MLYSVPGRLEYKLNIYMYIFYWTYWVKLYPTLLSKFTTKKHVQSPPVLKSSTMVGVVPIHVDPSFPGIKPTSQVSHVMPGLLHVWQLSIVHVS